MYRYREETAGCQRGRGQGCGLKKENSANEKPNYKKNFIKKINRMKVTP